MAFRVGQEVGGYRFLGVLQMDGGSMTHAVENLEAGRREHLKLLPGELNNDPSMRERFLREAAIHSKLEHPGIAQLYRGFELDGRLVMTLESIAGRPLEQRLAEGPLALIEAVDIAIATLDALAYAHVRDVVHREVTPRTIYLTPGGGVKLTGFGLARQAADPRLTAPGTMSGSIHYMAPEQAKGRGDLDCRSDIYSLGVVLYEMVGGTRPFESRGQFDIIQAHVMKAPPPLEDLRDELPPSLCAAVMRALEKFPDERFSSAAEFREVLEGVRREALTLEAEPKPLKAHAPVEDLKGSIRNDETALPPLIPSRRAAKAGAAEAAWEEESEGWETRDLIVVGALTFIIVVALVLAVLVVLNR